MTQELEDLQMLRVSAKHPPQTLERLSGKSSSATLGLCSCTARTQGIRNPSLPCIGKASGNKYYASVEFTEADKEAMDMPIFSIYVVSSVCKDLFSRLYITCNHIAYV